MFIRFDKKSLHIDVLVGVEEKYEPNQEIIDLYHRARELKDQFENKIEELFKTKIQSEIFKKLEDDKNLETQWKEFLNDSFLIEVKKIDEKIGEINKSSI